MELVLPFSFPSKIWTQMCALYMGKCGNMLLEGKKIYMMSPGSATEYPHTTLHPQICVLLISLMNLWTPASPLLCHFSKHTPLL